MRTSGRGRGGRPPRRLAAEQGSLLVEVMVTATVALVVGFGVLSMVDRTGDLSGEQRTQAIAGNLAQVEIDTVKAMPLSQLSNMRRSTTQRVSGVDYSITTRGDWVNDTAMAPNCTTAGASADYLKIQTTVTHPTIAPRSPVVLDTIISPPVRSFSPNQGSLAVLVTDRAGAPVPGLSVSLTGPATFTDDTNANGCVLWGYLPAGSGYTLAFSKAGYVTTDGSAGGGSASVAGDATTNVNYQFDRGGSFSTSFKVKTTTGALIDTRPSVVRVENGTGSGFSRNYDIGTASSLDTAPSGLLFPFTSPYAVYADNCAAAKPTSNLTAPAVTPGTAVQAADTILPALHVTVQNNGSGAPVNNATVRVVTACGTLYTRQTNSQGRLADPGFPFGTGFRVCATNGTRKRVISSQANTSFANAGTPVTLDIGSSGSTTTNPNACP